jgi:hypothetical protein
MVMVWATQGVCQMAFLVGAESGSHQTPPEESSLLYLFVLFVLFVLCVCVCVCLFVCLFCFCFLLFCFLLLNVFFLR